MGNLLKYSGIVTKIRAMEAKLLTPEQFADIANLRSVPDIADYLRKNTAYAEVLDTLTEDQIHRGNNEYPGYGLLQFYKLKGKRTGHLKEIADVLGDEMNNIKL